MPLMLKHLLRAFYTVLVMACTGLHAEGTFVFSNRIRPTSPPIRLCDGAEPIDLANHTVHVRVFNPGNGTFNEVLRAGSPFTGTRPVKGFFNAGVLTVPFLAAGDQAELEIEIRDSSWGSGMGRGAFFRVFVDALGGGMVPPPSLPELPGRWSYGQGYRLQFPLGHQVMEGAEIPVVLEFAAAYQEFHPINAIDPAATPPGYPSPASIASGLVFGRDYFGPANPPVTNLVLGEWRGILTNLTYRARPGNYGTDFVVTGIAGSHCTLAVNWTANRIEVLPDPRRPFLVSAAHAEPALGLVRFRGLAGQSHTVESSTDLVRWIQVGTFLGTTDEVEIPGSGPDQTSARFYRLAP